MLYTAMQKLQLTHATATKLCMVALICAGTQYGTCFMSPDA